jgi:hypothetical protein
MLIEQDNFRLYAIDTNVYTFYHENQICLLLCRVDLIKLCLKEY